MCVCVCVHATHSDGKCLLVDDLHRKLGTRAFLKHQLHLSTRPSAERSQGRSPTNCCYQEEPNTLPSQLLGHDVFCSEFLQEKMKMKMAAQDDKNKNREQEEGDWSHQTVCLSLYVARFSHTLQWVREKGLHVS